MLPEWRIGGDATLLDAERDALRCLHRQWRIARDLFCKRNRGREQVGERHDMIDQPEFGGARGGDRVAGEHIFHRELLRQLLCRSEEHTSELQSLMRISYAVFCLKKKILTLIHCIYNVEINLY